MKILPATQLVAIFAVVLLSTILPAKQVIATEVPLAVTTGEVVAALRAPVTPETTPMLMYAIGVIDAAYVGAVMQYVDKGFAGDVAAKLVVANCGTPNELFADIGSVVLKLKYTDPAMKVPFAITALWLTSKACVKQGSKA